MAAEFEAEKAALEAGLRAQLADAAGEHNALRRWGCTCLWKAPPAARTGACLMLAAMVMCQQKASGMLHSRLVLCLHRVHHGARPTHGAVPLSPSRLLQVRTKELRQVRRLAQEVLLQRSDVEAFLVSSIQQVRAEMAAEAAAAAAAGAPSAAALGQRAGGAVQAPAGSASSGELASSSSFPAGSGAGPGLGHVASVADAAVPDDHDGMSNASSSSSGDCSQVQAGTATAAAAAAAGDGSISTGRGTTGQMDIKQLSWQDRERILRLLFAKINRASQVRAVYS